MNGWVLAVQCFPWVWFFECTVTYRFGSVLL